MKQPRKWIDASGDEVPAKYVSAYDKERDAIARRIRARFARCADLLETCYCASMQDIEALERLAAADGRPVGGAKGNLQFCSFDGLIRIERSARYEIAFDERLQAARDLIYDVINEKSDGVDADIANIVRKVFEPVSSGMLSTSRVLGLFTYKVKAEKWQRAMDMIRDSISRRRGKTLLSCAEKVSRDADWQPILLDLARCACKFGTQEAQS
jgi:hypothetical protein